MSKSPFRQESLDEVLTPLSMEQTESTVPQKIISDLKYLGQVHATYLLFEDKDGLVVVDQHAIHERLRFNELRAQWEGSPCPSQKYLVPKVVALSIDLIRVAEIEKDTLLKLGFDLVPFGESELALSSRPIWLEEDRVAGVLRECLHSLQDEPASSSTSPPVLEKLIATLACHSVVRAGQSLSYREVEPLIQGLIEGQKDFDSGWTCPHGRPVIFRLNWSLFEKFFERC
jgi:DNA mismatch repair protein MutL